MITFLIGGARSGKSALAVELGRRHEAAGGRVVFVATGPQIADDDAWAARVARHRADRPAEWVTIEAPLDVIGAVREVDDDALVIVDCLTLWVSNQMFAGSDADTIAKRVAELADAIASRHGDAVAVSNEVGLGLHPDTELGREYRDALGWANQRVAAIATTTLMLVAGRAVPLADPGSFLPDSTPGVV